MWYCFVPSLNSNACTCKHCNSFNAVCIKSFSSTLITLSRFRGVTIDGVWTGYWIYWQTCTHQSEIQVITALSLSSTIHRSPHHPLSLFPACRVFNSRFLATASRAHVVTIRRISRNWTLVNSTIAPSLLSLECRAQLNCQPSTNSFTNQLLHFTSLSWTANWQPNCSELESELLYDWRFTSQSCSQAPWDSRPEFFSTESLR
jgi:hypothetical protein